MLLRKVFPAAVSRALVAGVVIAMPALVMAGDEAPKPKNPFEGKAEIVPEGASLLNQYCSHCHGPNAVQGERMRDLRRLNLRYGDDMISTFWTTVQNGRMDKGMPIWGGVLPDETLWKIYTFLQSVQSE